MCDTGRSWLQTAGKKELVIATAYSQFKVIQVLQSCRLKFTKARSDLADTSYSGVNMLKSMRLLRFNPEAKPRLCCSLEMGQSWVKMCLLVLDVAPDAA